MSEEKRINLAVINADGSNRDTSLKSTKRNETLGKLAAGISDVLERFDNPQLLTVSEFVSDNASRALLKNLNNSFNYCGGKFPSRDYIATFWNEDVLAPEYRQGKFDMDWSDVGKYCGVILQYGETDKKILNLSVHLPTKKSADKRKKAIDALKKYMEDCIRDKDINGIITNGDFNMSPKEIRNSFNMGNLLLAIEDEKEKTTTGKHSIDNVVTTDDIKPKLKKKDTLIKLTHHPLHVELDISELF